ncbi:putative aldo keto protein [Botrytis fragariae]|uniref:Putative aldo keto protein n=1 Tax=Botrytis fragariae TaxID=1964551 RepID=A0A8H6EK42_9HELO|nr:putative aldo keto protein [Botrytis fragariae]KAF5875207.1 putative aldo keto protein [Botrytis fragariae]
MPGTPPFTLFGGASFGEGLLATAEDIQQLLALLVTLNIGHIDTAAIYPLSSQGKSEQLLGENYADHSFAIDTEIKLADFSGKGSLTASAINESVTESLSRIKTKLGISNFSVAQVQELLEVCEKEGYAKPSYYQGQYNALCREAEMQLLPISRQQKISYITHSPLAGGFLTGIFTLGTDVTGTKFEDGNSKGDFFKRRYDNEHTHSAMKEFITLLQPYDITPSEAALRWIYYHSPLQEDDGVILGASKPVQISLNAADIAKGPLPSDVAEAMERMWTNIQAHM